MPDAALDGTTTRSPDPILDPTGGTAAAGTGPAPGLSPRRADLRGATVGLLENTKHHADLLLDELAALLAERHGIAGVLRRTKTAFALPVPDDLRTELVEQCDVVITGVGDCGSCSASAVADGIALEAAGIPTAVICTDAFVATAQAMAALRGSPDYRYLTTAHPVAVLTPEQVAARAAELLPGVLAGLTGAGDPAQPVRGRIPEQQGRERRSAG